ncbi:ABC transporter ATP-binding protein [Parvimonas micra]|uniref:ABC transporter ATP-binding protein n=1 Tax=Parvimonas micra TaxID=33033 RepID=A0A930E550_9FIRM|nr:ABC transporter ATP-binding protein [Parvimonas micra]MBF1307276.1 ABC transporter ATP-binding protein [Parvimonas micra]
MNKFFKNLKTIFELLFKKSFFWSFTMIVTYLIQVAVSFLYVYSIDNFFQSIYKNYSIDNGKILYPFLFFAVVVLLKHITDGINVFTINSFNKKIMSETKLTIIDKMNRFKYNNFEDVDKLNFIDSVKNVRMDSILIFYLSMFFYYIPYSIFLIFYLYNINYFVGITSIFLLLPILFSKIFQIKYSSHFEKNIVNVRRKSQMFMNYFFEIDTLRDIKSFCSEEYFIDLYKSYNEDYIDKKYKFQKKTLNMEIVFKGLVSVIFAVLLYILVKLTLLKYINAATFSSSLVIISELVSSSVSLIIYDSVLLLENYAPFKNYFKFYNDEVDFDYISNNTEDSEIISFSDVFFKYKNSDEEVIKNMSFCVNKGEKVAIIGKNGSGKSSLLKLLLGMYEETSGDIQMIKNNSVVFQDYCRYKLNLKENIIISDTKSDFDSNRFDDAFEITELSKKFEDIDVELSKEFSGVSPSGGTWNNISIARCIYKDADIYFMDEPMANFDSIKEKEIFDKLIKYFDDKTVIFITHNLGIVKKFDKIILIDSGEIKAIGNHKFLFENCDLYKSLFETQKNMYK